MKRSTHKRQKRRLIEKKKKEARQTQREGKKQTDERTGAR